MTNWVFFQPHVLVPHIPQPVLKQFSELMWHRQAWKIQHTVACARLICQDVGTELFALLTGRYL